MTRLRAYIAAVTAHLAGLEPLERFAVANAFLAFGGILCGALAGGGLLGLAVAAAAVSAGNYWLRARFPEPCLTSCRAVFAPVEVPVPVAFRNSAGEAIAGVTKTELRPELRVDLSVRRGLKP